MSENCDQNCNGCQENCSDRKEEFDFSAPANEFSQVKKVIGVVSGKGGVGKSLVTSLLAVQMMRKGHATAILDADLTGPSIPKAFGLKERAMGSEEGLMPVYTKNNIGVMSINLLLENESDPVVWRGPLIAGTVKQFWSDVIWGDVDYMFIDMPPGTGDVALTVFQSIPVDGIIVVTSPQELVSMIVKKAVRMANMMNIPVLGLVENMAYFKCPDCGSEHRIFGQSRLESIAAAYSLPILGRIPIDPKIAAACDAGKIEECEGDWLDRAADMLIRSVNKDDETAAGSATDTEKAATEEKGSGTMKIAVATDRGSVTEHFGHCENFVIFTVGNGKIIGEENCPNPGHKPGFLPVYLDERGVNVIISGGMGGGAVDLFNEKGIEVVTGASGDTRKAAEAYLSGDLKSTGSVCHEHNHSDECGN